MLHQARRRCRDRRGLDEHGERPGDAAGRLAAGPAATAVDDCKLRARRKHPHARVRAHAPTRSAAPRTRSSTSSSCSVSAHPFYNSRAGGGEGHLEVAKNIYYTNKDLAHMVLASSRSAACPARSRTAPRRRWSAHFQDMIFLPIETSGEGDINAHSRVQMALGEAKARRRTEFRRCCAATGVPLETIRAYVAAHRATLAATAAAHSPRIAGRGRQGRAASAVHVGVADASVTGCAAAALGAPRPRHERLRLSRPRAACGSRPRFPMPAVLIQIDRGQSRGIATPPCRPFAPARVLPTRSDRRHRRRLDHRQGRRRRSGDRSRSSGATTSATRPSSRRSASRC